MIRPPIHCLLDCLAFLIQSRSGIDTRPIYLGIWNASFIADEDGFSYYSERIDPNADILGFEQLYGQCLTRWQDPLWSKEQQFAKLERELEASGPKRTIITLVDLYYMPHSTICYGMKHMPHMLIVELGQDGRLLVKDPFFDWEGEVQRSVMHEAFTCEGLSSGITLHLDKAAEPDPGLVGELFRQQFTVAASQLISGVDNYLLNIECGISNYTVEKLYASIGQVGVIAKRWKSFGLMADYFAAAGGNAEPLQAKLEQLLAKWENVVLVIVRLGVLGNHAKLPEARAKLEQLAELEAGIRSELWTLYEHWEVNRHEPAR
ncbi:DUF6005 family protein [Paenibacillus sp. HB172176]|uniref:DUF6005 family protein n=1 Tax=Paenibacillus sp. HB172176 TaxID=2493690 RepID=UPI00143925D3|nr:DUF6005 family protein [Paenibacillus sp. HB172176]